VEVEGGIKVVFWFLVVDCQESFNESWKGNFLKDQEMLERYFLPDPELLGVISSATSNCTKFVARCLVKPTLIEGRFQKWLINLAFPFVASICCVSVNLMPFVISCKLKMKWIWVKLIFNFMVIIIMTEGCTHPYLFFFIISISWLCCIYLIF